METTTDKTAAGVYVPARLDLIRRITIEMMALKYDIPRSVIAEAEQIAMEVVDGTDAETEATDGNDD